MKTLPLCLAVGVLASFTNFARASLITGTGSPDTAPSLVGGTVVNFDSGPVGQFPSVTFGNMTLTGVDANFTIGSDYIGLFNTFGTYSVYNGFSYAPWSFRFDFASPVDAFAFNWGAADVNWTLSAYDSGNTLLESYVIFPTDGSNAGEFFGIAASGISHATLINNEGEASDYVFIDNVTTAGGGPSVPDSASTLGLMVLGIGAIAAGLRRR